MLKHETKATYLLYISKSSADKYNSSVNRNPSMYKSPKNT